MKYYCVLLFTTAANKTADTNKAGNNCYNDQWIIHYVTVLKNVIKKSGTDKLNYKQKQICIKYGS